MMVAYGWTEEHLRIACRYASDRLTKEGGVAIELRYPEVKTYNCRLGNCTIRFTLGFATSTAKRKDGTYLPGVVYNSERVRKLLPKQPIPTPEVMNKRKSIHFIHNQGREYVDVMRTRSTGSLCWHSYGHFMAKLFDLNPGGKLRTGANVYEGRADFQTKAGYNPSQAKCDCAEHGLMSFMQVRE